MSQSLRMFRSHMGALMSATALYHSAQLLISAQEAENIRDNLRDEEDARRKAQEAAELEVASMAFPEPKPDPLAHLTQRDRDRLAAAEAIERFNIAMVTP